MAKPNVPTQKEIIIMKINSFRQDMDLHLQKHKYVIKETEEKYKNVNFRVATDGAIYVTSAIGKTIELKDKKGNITKKKITRNSWVRIWDAEEIERIKNYGILVGITKNISMLEKELAGIVASESATTAK